MSGVIDWVMITKHTVTDRFSNNTVRLCNDDWRPRDFTEINLLQLVYTNPASS